ncbi:MAG: hypothetical protein JSV33_05645 [bacterium]|nr:MAG: hypothetical protein JSV33_05645 [bacterium]
MPDKEQAEIKQLLSQAARDEAERNKYEIETQEIQRRIKQKWYRGRPLIQALIGGVVGSALIAAWLIGYFRPLLSADQELAERRNALAAEEIRQLRFDLEAEKRKNALERRSLENQVSQYQKQLEDLKRQNEEFQETVAQAEARSKAVQERLQQTLDSYREELAPTSSDAEREKIDRLSRTANAEIRQLDTTIDEFKNVRQATEQRSTQIDKRLKGIGNIKFVVSLFSLNVDRKRHEAMREYFIDGGYAFDDDWVLPERYSWVALESTVFYYHDDVAAKAREIASDLERITQTSFKVARGAGLGVSKGQERWTFYVHYIAER